MWPSITVAAFVAVGFNSLLVWRIRSDRLRRVHWPAFALAAGFFWGVLALILHLIYWDSYYRYFAPAYVNWLTPIAALFYALICLGILWLARCLPGNTVINFCLLGALESIPEHILAIYKLHILEIPMFQGVSSSSIFIFAFFEYAIFWGAVILLAVLIDKVWPRT